MLTHSDRGSALVIDQVAVSRIIREKRIASYIMIQVVDSRSGFPNMTISAEN